MVKKPSQQDPQQARQESGTDKLKGVAERQSTLTLTQHAQQSTAVQMACRKGASGQGHGHCAQQSGQQGDQVEEFAGTVQGLAHFRAPTLQGLDLNASDSTAVRLFPSPSDKGFGLFVFTGDRHSVGQTTGRLHQSGRLQVSLIEHDPWRKIHETGASVWFLRNAGSDGQAVFTDLEHIASCQTQAFQQTGVHPDLPGCRDTLGDLDCLTRLNDLDLTPQRIARADRLECYQFAGPARRKRHGREIHGGIAHQAPLIGL